MKKLKKTRKLKKKFKLKTVRTPNDIQIGEDMSLVSTTEKINAQISANKCWTEECSRLFKSNGHALFLYDRLEYAIGKAYGSHNPKILLNPVTVLCHHPECMKSNNPIVRLKTMMDLTRYLDHLLDHPDEIGAAMFKRFGAVARSPFLTEKELDEINCSPYSLQPTVRYNSIIRKVLTSYGIDRKLKSNYICHWKNVLINKNLINSSSLSFQEDEALIYTILHYPNPIRDWYIFSTLSFYCLKFIVAVGESGLNLYRGITRQRVVRQGDGFDLHQFVADINHPGPSVTTLQNIMPKLTHENEIMHTKESIFHLKLLGKIRSSLSLDFPLVKRYPVTLGIDEQELNQGVTIQEGKLHGIEKPLTPQQIHEIGLNNLANYIAEHNHFINAAREYRLTDLKGIFCSNVNTWFLSEVLKSEQVIQHLKKVVQHSSTCLHCLLKDLTCDYQYIHEQCGECKKLGLECISMLVVVTLWDMGSSHKKAAIEMPSLDSKSEGRDLYRRDLFSFVFGGLHLCKACVNCSRNHVLTSSGENYGVHVLRQLKNQFEELFQLVKNAVIVGKDRQSDLLSYSTCNEIIQHILEVLKIYEIIRIPEEVLTFTDKAKTQKRFVLPVAIAANKNGDVFVLDSGAACIHVADRSSVTKVTILGKYKCPSTASYGKSCNLPKKASNLLISSGISDMIIVDDVMFVADQLRNEIAIIVQCRIASKIQKSKLHVMKIESCVSLSSVGQHLVVLEKDMGVSNIQVLALPPLDKHESFYVSPQIIAYFLPEAEVELISLFLLPNNHFGAQTSEKELMAFQITDGEITQINTRSSIRSKCRPCLFDNKLVIHDEDEVNSLNQMSIIFDDAMELQSIEQINCSFYPFIVSSWGKTLLMVCQRDVNDFVLVEFGNLSFGLEFCRSVNNLYKAVSYVPPHGDPSCRNMKLSECIDLMVKGSELLNKMQASLEERFIGLRSFAGGHGAIFTKTLNCINTSIDSLKGVDNRLNELSGGSEVTVYVHTLINESIVEHSFGETHQKGQGNLQNKEEYSQAKRRSQINFHIKMCDAPFNQYVKVKKRDQGYQAIRKGDTKLTLDDLKEIFHESGERNVEPRAESESDTVTLKCAFNIAKSVPRQSNRCKWREKSGFAPNMLQLSSSNSGKLFSGDLVFMKYLNNQLLNLIVTEDVVLNDVDMSLKVKMFHGDGSEEVCSVKLGQLVKDGSTTVAIPSNMYRLNDDGEIELDENISYMFEAIMNKQIVSRTDMEWSEFFGIEMSNNRSVVENSMEPEVSDNEEFPVCRRKSRKRRKIQPI